MRREGRILAIQFLWSKTLNPDSQMNLDFLSLFEQETSIEFSSLLIKELNLHEKEILLEISQRAKNWKLSRIFSLDLIILKLALLEILFLETPKKVAINEYLEISKILSEENSASFINGILDNR